MARLPKVVINEAEVRKLLRGEGRYKNVREDLARRARNIANAAGPGFQAETDVGQTRARSAVFTATQDAKKAEATDAALTRSIDAGRN